MKKFISLLLTVLLLASMLALPASAAGSARLSYTLTYTDKNGSEYSDLSHFSEGDTVTVEVKLARSDVSGSYSVYGLEFAFMTRGLTYGNDGEKWGADVGVRYEEHRLPDGEDMLSFPYYDTERIGVEISNPVTVARCTYTISDASTASLRVSTALVYITGDSNNPYVPTHVDSFNTNGHGGAAGGSTEPDAPALNTADHVNYLMGYTDGTIRPNANITRAEAATIFFRLLTDESRAQYMTRTSSFSDVPADAWYTTAVATLSNAGIINGYDDGTFRPNMNITRAEMATIIARFGKSTGTGTSSFTDIAGHWAKKNIETAAGNGWINGYDDGTFRPDRNITRAETVAMVNRVLGRGVESAEQLVSGMNTWSDNMDTSAWYYLHIQEASSNHSYEKSSGAETWSAKLTDIDWEKYQY